MIRETWAEKVEPVREGNAGGPYYALMTEALSAILQERGILSAEEIESFVRGLEAPAQNGERILLHEPGLMTISRHRLLANGREAAGELGYSIRKHGSSSSRILRE